MRKTFDMIQDISESENKEVGDGSKSIFKAFIFHCILGLVANLKFVEHLNLSTGLQEILGELWQVYKVGMH